MALLLPLEQSVFSPFLFSPKEKSLFQLYWVSKLPSKHNLKQYVIIFSFADQSLTDMSEGKIDSYP